MRVSLFYTVRGLEADFSFLFFLDQFFLNGYHKDMTREEILKELTQLKNRQASCHGSRCEVYGQNEITSARRINGCCIKVTKGKNEKI